MAELKKREKILMGVAAVTAVFFVIDRFVCQRSQEAVPQQFSERPPAQQIVKTPGKVVPVTKKKVVRKKIKRKKTTPTITYVTWGRDPFASAIRLEQLDHSQKDSTGLVLKGVIRKNGQAYVLIDDAILKEGEHKGDLQILSIKKDRVVCRKGAQVITLVLRENENY